MDQEKNKKRILFISDLTFIHTIGGTEVATARLLNGLSQEGEHEIFLFSGKKKGTVVRGELPDSNICIDRFLLLSVPGDKGFNNFVLPNIFHMWHRIRQISPDIIHVHCPSFFGLIGVVMAKSLNIPSVYTAHMFTEHFTTRIAPRLRPIGTKFFDTLLKKYMGWFDSIVYPSEIRKNKALETYHLQNQAIVISNGYTRKESMNKYSRKDAWQEKIVFFTVSRLTPEKNIKLIIDSFDEARNKNPDMLLCIIGDGIIKEQLEDYTKTKKHASSIELVGEKINDDLEYYYTMGDVFVSASDHESEGLTTLEAISHGKPIILSSSPGNAAKQFFCDNGYIFQSGDMNDFASKMLDISSNGELIDIMGQKSLEKSSEYEFRHSLVKYKQFYSSLSR